MHIRDARAADVDAISELYRSLVGDPHVRVRAERVEAISADANSYLLVCEREARVCGTLLLNLCLDAMYGLQPFAVIENVVVAEDCRRLGMGSALLRRAELIAVQQDCSKIMLLSSEHRVAAHRFFTRERFSPASKLGFVKYRRDFRCERES